MEIVDFLIQILAGTGAASNLTQYTFPVKAQPENCLRCTDVSYMHAPLQDVHDLILSCSLPA